VPILTTFVAENATLDRHGHLEATDTLDETLLDDDEALVLEFAEFETSEDCRDSWLLASISDTIARLLKLSALLSKSSARDRFAKAQTASSTKFDERYDVAHVIAKFGGHGAELWLLSRLGKANAMRRQYLSYCRTHHEKLSIPPVHPNAGEVDTNRNYCDQVAPSLPDTGWIARSSKASAVQTKASTLGPVDLEAHDDGFDDTRSYTTLATSMGNDACNGRRLKVPSLTDYCTAGEVFECPYCCTLGKFNGQLSWK